jgi:hypothetical protein
MFRAASARAYDLRMHASFRNSGRIELTLPCEFASFNRLPESFVQFVVLFSSLRFAMKSLLPLVLVFLLVPFTVRSQSKPDVLVVNQPDPLTCCYELRLENRHTPQSKLDRLTLRIITPGVRFQPGAPGPWPAHESDTMLIFGESGLELPPGESADGFIVCLEFPTGSNGAFKIVWSTAWKNNTVTVDTLSIVCTGKAPACDSILVASVSPPDQPEGSCSYELTLQNRHEPAGPLNGMQLSILTPGAEFVGSPVGPWSGSVVNSTTVEFLTDDATLNSGEQLGGFRVFIRPPGGIWEPILLRWTSMLGGNLVCDEMFGVTCTPTIKPRSDSMAVRKGIDCSMYLSMYNKHQPQSGLDGMRVSIVTPGASIESLSPPIGWSTLSQSGIIATFTKNSGTLAPNDSITGFNVRLKPSESGLVQFSVCTMLQNSVVSCDTLQVQCDPPPPSTCDSVITVRTGTTCTFDFGFANQHQPAGIVNDFHVKLQTPGVAISSVTPPPGWKIRRQTATEVEFSDTLGSVQAGGRQTGFMFSLQGGSAVGQIFYQWCTSRDGNILCCEYDAVSCEQIVPRCDSLAVTALGEYCTYRVDVGNLRVPRSDFNTVHFSLRDPATMLFGALAPDGWVVDSSSSTGIIFRKTDGSVASGGVAEGFELSLLPSAVSNRIAIDWCTALDGQSICCDTMSVFCSYKLVAPDRVNVLTDTARACCFEFSVDNDHLPMSALTSFSAEVLTPGVTLYASTIASPAEWTAVTNDRKVTWRSTTSELPPGEAIRGFVVCYDNDASGNADFGVVWQTVSNGLIITEDTVTIKCDRTLSVELFDARMPDEIRLQQNYPNPFNPVTTIRFDLPEARAVELTLHDSHGRLIMDIGSGTYGAGSWAIRFDASSLASGTYFYRLRTGNAELTRSMLLLR